MQATPNMESVTLSLPHDDMAVLRLLSKRMGWKMKARSATPPCQYTEEEVVQRVLQATADVDAGRGLMSHEEFKKQVICCRTSPL